MQPCWNCTTAPMDHSGPISSSAILKLAHMHSLLMGLLMPAMPLLMAARAPDVPFLPYTPTEPSLKLCLQTVPYNRSSTLAISPQAAVGEQCVILSMDRRSVLSDSGMWTCNESPTVGAACCDTTSVSAGVMWVSVKSCVFCMICHMSKSLQRQKASAGCALAYNDVLADAVSMSHPHPLLAKLCSRCHSLMLFLPLIHCSMRILICHLTLAHMKLLILLRHVAHITSFTTMICVDVT